MRVTRLHTLVAAGVVDSFGLALGWTVFTLHAVETQGLGAAGLYGAAMLVGVALSAAATSWISARLDGRRLLRSTASAEAVLRVVTFVLLLAQAPTAAIASAVALTYVMAWTGYAGMRAEVAAVDSGARTMTIYVMAIASIEAVGAAIGALLPIDARAVIGDAVLISVIVVHATSLVPTLVVAGGSRVTRAREPRGSRSLPKEARPLAAGFAIMAVASGPTLLSAALALELHGRMAVIAAAVAFTSGAVLAPLVTGWVGRRAHGPCLTWPALGIGMVVGWVAAPWHVAGLVFAQVLAGLSMTAFEGMMDARVAGQAPLSGITTALARAAAARALGSSLAVGLVPLAVASGSIGAASAFLSITLMACLVIGIVMLGAERRGEARIRQPVQPIPETPATAKLA
jgi:hypothetical protein